MEIGLRYKGKKINLEVKKLGFFGRFMGLMFSRRENAEPLLFDFGKQTRISIHSWFVFYPFLAVWTDKNNKTQEIRRIYSWNLSIKPKKSFVKLIEIPINRKYNKIVKLLDGD